MISLSRRKILSHTALTIGALALGAPKVRAATVLRVGIIGSYTPYMVVRYAVTNGYFPDLKIELTETRGAGPGMEMLAAGSLDIFTAPPPAAALARIKGADVKIFALSGIPSPAGFYLAVPAGSKIKTVADLNGATVAVTSLGASTDTFSQWTARNAGIKVQPVPLGSGVLPALYAGQTQAAVIFPIASYAALTSKKVVALQDYGELLADAVADMWIGTRDAIENKRPQLVSFLKGMGKAITDLQSDQALTLKLLAEYHNEKDEAVLKMAFEKMILPMRPDAMFNPENCDVSLKMAEASGMGKLLPASQIIDMTVLSK